MKTIKYCLMKLKHDLNILNFQHYQLLYFRKMINSQTAIMFFTCLKERYDVMFFYRFA